MNTMLFKSAYDKVRLSEEFKAMAKQRLMQFGENHDISLADTEGSEVMAYTVPEKNRSAWKIVLGFGALAAAVAVAVVIGVNSGRNALIDTGSSPLASDSGVSLDMVPEKLIERSITFPAYIDEQVEFNYIVSETEPFEFKISLPESWEIVVPEGSARMGKSMVFIMDGDECVGSIDCGTYKDLTGDQYGFDGVEYGHPEYHQMVMMGITNAETRNDWMPDFIECEKVTGEWVMQSYDIDVVEDYNEVKAEDSMTAAACTIYRNISDPNLADRLYYGSGIIAFDPDRLVYVMVCFADMLETEMHNEIVKSTEIQIPQLGSIQIGDEIAKKFADEWSVISAESMMVLPEASVFLVRSTKDFDNVIGIVYPEYKTNRTVFYGVKNAEIIDIGSIPSGWQFEVMDNGEDELLHVVYVLSGSGGMSEIEDNYYKISSDGVTLVNSYGRMESNGSANEWFRYEDGSVKELTLDEYNNAMAEIVEEYSVTQCIDLDKDADFSNDNYFDFLDDTDGFSEYIADMLEAQTHIELAPRIEISDKEQ